MRPDFGFPELFAHTALLKNTPATYIVYPNPANTHIYIDKPAGKAETTGRYNVTMFNALGQEVLHALYPLLNTQLDISSIPHGLYFLKIQEEQTGTSQIQKLLISR